jgi:hypothetical protein
LAFKKVPELGTVHISTVTMGSIARSLRPVCAPHLHPKHATRIQLLNTIRAPAWSRSFHASASLRVVDLAYSLHDNKGSAKGDPIVIIHGLFGSKKNNRSVSKYVSVTIRHSNRGRQLTIRALVRWRALSIAPYMPSILATTAILRTIRRTTTLRSLTTLKHS